MIPGYMLAGNRRAQRDASIARVEWAATLERRRAAERRARDTLREAIVAGGVASHLGVAILAAADSLRKAAVIAALAERIEPDPASQDEP